MKQLKKLSRLEMKKISGGSFPTCSVGCLSGDFGYLSVKIGNTGQGCFDPIVQSACPDGYDVIACSCP